MRNSSTQLGSLNRAKKHTSCFGAVTLKKYVFWEAFCLPFAIFSYSSGAVAIITLKLGVTLIFRVNNALARLWDTETAFSHLTLTYPRHIKQNVWKSKMCFFREFLGKYAFSNFTCIHCLIWRGYVNVRWLRVVSVSHNRAKALLARKINVTPSLGVNFTTAPIKF